MTTRLAACAAIVIGAALSLRAAEVTEAVAKEAVAGWASLQEPLTAKDRFAGAAVAKVETFSGRDGLGVFHVVSFEGGGFAVTSGDTEITPILAYAEDGEFVSGDENPLWVMLTRDVAGRTKRLGEDSSAAKGANGPKDDGEGLEYGEEEDAAETEPSANALAWARLRGAAKPKKPLLKAKLPRVGSIAEPIYGPLCETVWRQGSVNKLTCYNYYTPSNYVCGCVATAMAQVMHKFKWPQAKVTLGDSAHSGKFVWVDAATSVTNTMTWHIGGKYGETWEFGGPAFGGPYDWNNMIANPGQAATAGTLTEVQRQAVGFLCRDCGISVNMSYNLGGSGADTGNIADRLVDTFGYKNAARRQNGNPISLTEQLDAYLPSFAMGSPCAVGISGHAIVADGYGLNTDGRHYVHYNYGWGYSAWYTPPDEKETDTEYATVYKIVYNIMTPEAQYDEYEPGVCFVSGTVLDEDRTTPVASATVTATDAATGAQATCTTDATGAFSLRLQPGYEYSLNAEKGGVTAGKKLGAVVCTRESVGNKRNVKLVLGIGVDNTPAALLHRWSFNGETAEERLADSAGDSAATVCGTDVVFADGKVSLSGNGNGSGYVSLGTNTIPDTATLEIWAREDAVKKWGRIFDYGVDSANYVTLTWTSGTDQRSERFSAFGANATANRDGSMAPYTPGTMYHISVTFEKDAVDGSTFVHLMRRDAKTGELQRMGSLTVANFEMSAIKDAILYLGHSQYADDPDANATYDEVRVWSGVLTDDQLKANAIAGPDVADLDEAAQVASEADVSAEYEGGHTATRRGRIAFGRSRGGKGSADIAWPTLALSDYTDDGVHDIAELNRASDAVNSPSGLGWSQLRYDGWFEVTEEQAGWWAFNQKFDDHFLFAIDGDTAIFNHTYSSLATSRVRVTKGWHRFTIICGDSSGGYGAQYELKDGNGDTVMLVPFTVTVGGDELAFSPENFNFGADSEDSVITLTEDTDWTEKGVMMLSPGTKIDLNGHSLKAVDIIADGVGVAVTNTTDRTGRVFLADGATSSGVKVFDGGVKVWNGGELMWVQETADTTGLTGEWTNDVVYDSLTGAAELSGENTFMAYYESEGDVVTVRITTTFDTMPTENLSLDEGSQGGIWIGPEGNFQVWTSNGWVDVVAEGVMPEIGVEYTVRVVFDYKAGTYSAAIKASAGDASVDYVPLAAKGKGDGPSVTAFPLAVQTSCLSGVAFRGDGALRSILGEYAVTVEGFAEDEEVVLKDNASAILSAAQAAWLNGLGDKAAVAQALAGLSGDTFNEAYLLNIDVTKGAFSYSFDITGIDVFDDRVEIAVSLVRNGETKGAINGRLKFYGAATLEAFKSASEPVKEAMLTDDDFSEGTSATATIPLGEDKPAFFNAVIEAPLPSPQ